MDTVVVTRHFFGSVNSLFQNQGGARLLEEKYSRFSCDLVVFTGGEDVHPKFYAGNIGENSNWYDVDRDKLELKVMKDILNGRIITKKVLGICRGLQLINVALGGNLIFDIWQEYGKSHGAIHPVSWVVETPLSKIYPEVNSMHHQGIRSVGRRKTPTILGIEPNTRIIEAILWGNKFLGVQFHPEAMKETGPKFADLISRWVRGEVSSLTSSEETLEKKVTENKMSYWAYDTNSGNTIDWTAVENNAAMFLENSEEEE